MTTYSAATEDKQPLKLSWINVGFFGTIHALAFLAPWCFSWSALGVMIFFHWLFGSIGICLGYHRLLSHRSLQLTPKWLEYAIVTIGALAMQGGPIFWVAGHRKHHAYTEDEDNLQKICSRFSTRSLLSLARSQFLTTANSRWHSIISLRWLVFCHLWCLSPSSSTLA